MSILFTTLLLAAQTGTLDQSSPFGNAWFNGGVSSLTWQSEVATGVGGTLEGFDLSIQGVAGATLDVSVKVGTGWNTGAAAWSGTLVAAGTGTWEIHFVDVSSAGIVLSPGDLWVIEMNGNTGMGIQGQYNPPPATPPYPEELYLGGPGCFADCGWRIGFNTYMLGGAGRPTLAKTGSCPGPITLTVTGATPGGSVALLFGNAGTYTHGGSPCTGITLGISNPSLGGFRPANGSGTASLSFNPLPGACGRTVQAVDLGTCLPSNTVVL